MIIECTECHTRFRLADEKIKPQGTKVRCSRCKHIFRVTPPPPEPEEVDFGADNMEYIPEKNLQKPARDGAFSAQATAAAPAEPAGETKTEPTSGSTENSSTEMDQAIEKEATSLRFDEQDFGRPPTSAFDASLQQEASEGMQQKESPASESPFDDQDQDGPSEFAFDDQDQGGPSEFAFDDQDQDDPSEFAFDDQDQDDPSEFVFDDQGQGDPSEFAFDDQDQDDATGFAFDEEPSPKTEEEVNNENFDLSAMTFGDEAPGEMTAEPQMPVPEPAEMSAPSLEEPFTGAPGEDMAPLAPPLPKPRRSPLRTLILLLLALFLILAGAVAFFLWRGGVSDLKGMINQVTGQQTAPSFESGEIKLSNLNSYFVNNREVGQLFVIEGTTRNAYQTARSAIAVKGVLFDNKGKIILQQTAFAGTSISQDELQVQPYAKIEESMNNQFGEALSNLNVAPGKSIPFTIVFKSLPDNLAEYTVEVVDSKAGSK